MVGQTPTDQLLDWFQADPDTDLASELLHCAHYLISVPRLGATAKEFPFRAFSVTVGTVRAATDAVLKSRTLPRLPHTPLTSLLTLENRRNEQALKITRCIESHYRSEPDPALAQFAVHARIETMLALFGLGRHREAFRATQTSIEAGEPGVAAFRLEKERRLSKVGSTHGWMAASYGLLEALAITELHDAATAVSAFDSYIATFEDNRSPVTRIFVQLAKGLRRDAQKSVKKPAV